MMFTSVSSHKDKDDKGKAHHKRIHKTNAPTKDDIQKKFDEQSFKHSMSQQWADVKKKCLFVPPEIVVSITSGEDPFIVTKEEKFSVTFFQRVFLLFDQPEHCFMGEVISFITMIVILISCIGYIAATGTKSIPDSCDHPACENEPDLCPDSMICPPEESAVFELIETVCITFFTVDYFTRLALVSLMPARLSGIIPNFFDVLNSNGIMPTPVYSIPVTLWRYMTIPMNIIDLVAILPFYVAYFSTSGSSVSIIRILRLVRVLRVFKIGGMGNGMTLMSNAMMNSLSAMGILLFFTVLGVILFGSIIFFLEAGTFMVNEEFPEGAFLRYNVLGIEREESPFSSILVSCYWAMVTFTTVGYGDLVPTSPGGRFVSLVLMYTGILVLALPISVIGANFQREYERLEDRNDDDEDDDVHGTAAAQQTLWDVALEETEREQLSSSKPPLPPAAAAAPKRGQLNSYGGSYRSNSKRDLFSSKKSSSSTQSRERTKSNASITSVSAEELMYEAMLPVTEQLSQLTLTCSQMMERIEQLQHQQNEMMHRISPSSEKKSKLLGASAGGDGMASCDMSTNGITKQLNEQQQHEEEEEEGGTGGGSKSRGGYRAPPLQEEGIELGRVEGGSGHADENGDGVISTSNSAANLVSTHSDGTSSSSYSSSY